MTNINQYLAAVGRIENFLANYERAGGLHPEEVYSIHSIPDGEEGVIRVSDLKTLLAEISRLTDSEDSRVVVLEAENRRLKVDAERAKPVLDAARAFRTATLSGERYDLAEHIGAIALAVNAAGHTKAVAEGRRRCPEALVFPDETMVVRCVRDAHSDDLHWNRDREMEWGELVAEGLSSTDTTATGDQVA